MTFHISSFVHLQVYDPSTGGANELTDSSTFHKERSRAGLRWGRRSAPSSEIGFESSAGEGPYPARFSSETYSFHKSPDGCGGWGGMTQLEKSRLIVSQSVSDSTYSTSAFFVSLQVGTPQDYTILMFVNVHDFFMRTIACTIIRHTRVTLFAEGMTNLGESPVTVLEATLAISALVALAYT